MGSTSNTIDISDSAANPDWV